MLGLRVRGAQLLNAELGEPLAHVDGLFERLALDDTRDETAGKGITSTVGIIDLVFADCVDRYLLDIDVTAVFCADGDGGVGTLGDDNSSWSLGVLLGQGSNLLRNFLDVLGLVTVGFCECSGLGLVADEDVDVWQELVEGILEELCDEGSGKVENKWLQELV